VRECGSMCLCFSMRSCEFKENAVRRKSRCLVCKEGSVTVEREKQEE
jgi:hypothetical protein